MRFSVLAISASIISAALAQVISVNVTHPIAGDAWVVGKPALISWVANIPTLPNNGNVTVELFHGPPTQQTLVQSLGSGSKQLKIVTPDVPADWYSVRINQDSYSHYFFISNATVTAPNVPEPGTATTTTALPVTTTTTMATTATANVTTSAPTQTATKPSAGNTLSAGNLAVGAAAVIAAILTL